MVAVVDHLAMGVLHCYYSFDTGYKTVVGRFGTLDIDEVPLVVGMDKKMRLLLLALRRKRYSQCLVDGNKNCGVLLP